jgi:uncharacterized membrane protein YjgN (DUF898 family)
MTDSITVAVSGSPAGPGEAPPSSGEAIRIDYVPRPGLLRLTLINFGLGVLTLSLYRFWARTNVRRHIWACVHINGQPLEYTGKGIELFKGAVIVFFILGLPAILSIAAINIALGPDHPAIAGIQLLLFLIVSLLWGAAVFRARRYQLSRTLWRGVRGALEGSAVTYSLTYFGAMLARGMTLGWSTPIMNLNLQEQIIGGMRFGNLPFRFKGRAGPLYRSYAVCWFLMLGFVIAGGALAFAAGISMFHEQWTANAEPDERQILAMLALAGMALVAYVLIYPIIWALYTARELAAFGSYTRIGSAQFRFDATMGSIIGLAIGNAVLWLLTLGVASPYIQQRLVRYLCERLSVVGMVEVDSVLQSAQPLDPTGEGLADALDIGGL